MCKKKQESKDEIAIRASEGKTMKPDSLRDRQSLEQEYRKVARDIAKGSSRGSEQLDRLNRIAEELKGLDVGEHGRRVGFTLPPRELCVLRVRPSEAEKAE